MVTVGSNFHLITVNHQNWKRYKKSTVKATTSLRPSHKRTCSQATVNLETPAYLNGGAVSVTSNKTPSVVFVFFGNSFFAYLWNFFFCYGSTPGSHFAPNFREFGVALRPGWIVNNCSLNSSWMVAEYIYLFLFWRIKMKLFMSVMNLLN